MNRPHLLMLCWGNICRSPMAERVAQSVAEESGLDLLVSSAGVSSEESGRGMDSRARRTLAAHGYDGEGHTARQLTADMLAGVDLVVAAEQYHLDRIEPLLATLDDRPEVALVSDFDPEANPGDPLPDPWYGDQDDFEGTLAVLERATPAMLERLTSR